MQYTDFQSVGGKVAVVTGAASGMGREIAKLFAANNVKVVVADIQDELGEKVVADIRANGGEAIFCHTNVMEEEDIKRCTELAVKEFGQLNIMVNNAGIGCALHPIHEYDTAGFKRVTELNYHGVFLGMKYGVKAMLDSKARGCSIINISSASGLEASSSYSCYAASKTAVIQLSKAACLDYVKHDITVNVICPGVVDTEIYSKLSEVQRTRSIGRVPMGRMGDPKEIAYMALFLVSDMARFMSGAVIAVDGGQTAGFYRDFEWETPDPRC